MPRGTLALALVVLLAGCDTAPPSAPRDASADGSPDGAPPARNRDCDPLDERQCALPWPSNLYLRPDPSRRTGYTLAFGDTSLPANSVLKHVNPEPWRRMDGYSVGTPIMVQLPGVDVSAIADENSIERSLAPDASVLLFEVDGQNLRRLPYFAELDRGATVPDDQVLFVRPAVILKEGTRYVVALRGLRDRAGRLFEPSRAFRALRDRTDGDRADLLPRRPRFEEVFSLLDGAGVPRASLLLAWDFVTASCDAVHGRMLQLRADAFQRVGPSGPALRVTETREFARATDGTGRPVNAHIALELQGTFEVPHYLRMQRNGRSSGYVFNLDAQGRPVANGTRAPRFWVRVPHSALGAEPHGLVLYGHGLLGSGDQVRGDFLGRIANNHRLIFFSADMTGMSSEDVPSVLSTVRDISNFPFIADRLHQGLTEWQLLARAARERLAGLPELSSRGVRVDPSELFYSGISQGGIFGASFLALSQDVRRGHLGVPGNNYSLLLQRSVDFTPYLAGIESAYELAADRAVLLAAVQLLWDGADPVTYYRHLRAEPFPDTLPHDALFVPARGDHQVAVLSLEISARTTELGLPLMAHYDQDRTPFGVTLQPYPHCGSGVVLYHFGNPWPPAGNLPPRDGLPDPHGLPRQLDHHTRQMVTFFRTGEITDTCGGDGCHPD
ncbi:MAG: hypothetical protein HY909_22565 [Deltaproteobacteria bacterium]|nr:hypothetical protein [Deltaproteobacteria bacterium]